MKPRVVVIGAGGHAMVVLEILEEMGEFEIVGCTSVQTDVRSVLDYPVLGNDDILTPLHASGVRHAFVALGENRLRRKLIGRVHEIGFTLINAISRSAVISSRAMLETGIAVMPGATINVNSLVGEGAIINTGAVVDHECAIGKYAHVAPGTSLAGKVTVGEGTMLGIGCRVIPEISIGAWSVVGAGAVVIGDVPDSTTVVGVPAIPVKAAEAVVRP